MADNENKGPTIGERVGTAIVDGVKQGVIGIAAGGAAGAAIGAIGGYILNEGGEAAKVAAQSYVGTAEGQQILSTINPNAAEQVISKVAESAQQNVETFTQPTVDAINNVAQQAREALTDGTVAVDEAKNLITAGYNQLVQPEINLAASEMMKGGALAGAAVGGAYEGAKGAATGLLKGSQAENTKRWATEGTKRGIESIISKAIEQGQQQQESFVQALQSERANPGPNIPVGKA